jgi:iron-sulfur cluster assembly protein
MSAQAITKDMTIGDVVQLYPHVADILMSNGVHCVGCGARFFETLEMGFKGHGMSDEQVAAIVTKLNEAVAKTPAVAEVIVLTEKAAEKLKEVMQQENQEGSILRVQVVGGGCGGAQYGLDFEKSVAEDDKVIEVHGIKLVVGAHALPFVRGARIDYADQGPSPGFRISNPSKRGGCGSGCGCG